MARVPRRPRRFHASRRLLTPLLGVLLLAGCSSAATPLPSASGSPLGASPTPAASAASSLAPSPAGSAATATVQALSGRWSVVASNARVVTATGSDVGGSVSIEGSRFTFVKGDHRVNGGIDFAGDLTLDCNATRCRVTGGTPGYEVRMDAGELALVSFVTLKRYGTGQPCSLPDLPGTGRITVTRTATVGGADVPAEVRMVGGFSSGVGTNCATSSFQVAWDLTGTRQP